MCDSSACECFDCVGDVWDFLNADELVCVCVFVCGSVMCVPFCDCVCHFFISSFSFCFGFCARRSDKGCPQKCVILGEEFALEMLNHAEVKRVVSEDVCRAHALDVGDNS